VFKNLRYDYNAFVSVFKNLKYDSNAFVSVFKNLRCHSNAFVSVFKNLRCHSNALILVSIRLGYDSLKSEYAFEFLNTGLALYDPACKILIAVFCCQLFYFFYGFPSLKDGAIDPE